ncbi:MAG: phosphoribosylformimino-5-aminoimidazole carboxamide ribotide isomerase [Lachnospiraceae bacterium]|nr:phosphoribosylformimino-5-aminoimidazole carboxamide ribotide isomerase [Lachnospiraceae bacterium]
MKFRPCIDIHNGAVKQIVGSTLRDAGDQAQENFVSEVDAPYYAKLYQEKGIRGGHVIMLNKADSPYYAQTKEQAIAALKAYPKGLQAGGGITPENAKEFLDAGASHVIVTSYVFAGGMIRFPNLEKLVATVGKRRLVLDVSCRFFGDGYYVCTDRWQKRTDYMLTPENLDTLSVYCDEFLIHAVDVEGKNSGIEKDLVALLSEWIDRHEEFHEKFTYAGGVRSISDIKTISELGDGHINVTVGSALDLFGGNLKMEEVLAFTQK